MPTLMIVDDEADVREFAKNFFKKRGIEVITASDGTEALPLLESSDPDLLLLDIRMKTMSGIEVLKELKARNRACKVVMVSGIDDENVVREAHSLGIRDFIHKPLVLEELEKVVLAQLQQCP